MRLPDWFVYSLILSAFVGVLFLSGSDDEDTPYLPDETLEETGLLLPAPSVFDDRILIEVGEPKDGVGTAFALNRRGRWLTARHVVEGCKEVAVQVGPSAYVPVSDIEIDPAHDLAVLTTGRSPNPVPVDFTTPLRIGTRGYMVGYPQGRPGEVATRLLARSRLISRGTRQSDDAVLVWVETGRTRGLKGSLGGLSGGPVFDASGNVRGVIVAESPRRGRVYTAAPSAVAAFLADMDISPERGDPHAFRAENYGDEGDRARRTLQVVKVSCRVKD